MFYLSLISLISFSLIIIVVIIISAVLILATIDTISIYDHMSDPPLLRRFTRRRAFFSASI